MSLWLVRGGRKGEFIADDFKHNLSIIGWALDDLSNITTKQEYAELYIKCYPEQLGSISYHVSQIWNFVNEIKTGDRIIMPIRGQPTVAFGKVTGPYRIFIDNIGSNRQARPVEWYEKDVLKNSLPPNILEKLNVRFTVYKIN